MAPHQEGKVPLRRAALGAEPAAGTSWLNRGLLGRLARGADHSTAPGKSPRTPLAQWTRSLDKKAEVQKAVTPMASGAWRVLWGGRYLHSCSRVSPIFLLQDPPTFLLQGPPTFLLWVPPPSCYGVPHLPAPGPHSHLPAPGTPPSSLLILSQPSCPTGLDSDQEPGTCQLPGTGRSFKKHVSWVLNVN